MPRQSGDVHATALLLHRREVISGIRHAGGRVPVEELSGQSFSGRIGARRKERETTVPDNFGRHPLKDFIGEVLENLLVPVAMHINESRCDMESRAVDRLPIGRRIDHTDILDCVVLQEQVRFFGLTATTVNNSAIHQYQWTVWRRGPDSGISHRSIVPPNSGWRQCGSRATLIRLGAG